MKTLKYTKKEIGEPLRIPVEFFDKEFVEGFEPVLINGILTNYLTNVNTTEQMDNLKSAVLKIIIEAQYNKNKIFKSCVDGQRILEMELNNEYYIMKLIEIKPHYE